MSEPAQQPRRRRRTAEEARQAILDAAQKRLAECGPEDVRLQDIAADLGISHPAILHHFGSREALMRELSRHAFEALNADLVVALDHGASKDATAWLDLVFDTLRNQGHARLLAWAVLTGRHEGSGDDDPQLLREFATATHARRCAAAARRGQEEPELEESLFAARFAAAALLGDALLGGVLRRSAGMQGDAARQERFHRWFAEVVNELLVPRSRS